MGEKHGWVVYTNTFTFAAGGTRSTTDNFPVIDLSRCSHLRFLFRITAADTDAGDLLEMRFQERGDMTTAFDDWDTRLRSPAFAGTLSPSSTAPEDYYMTLPCDVPLTGSDMSYEPTGSAGAAEVAANSVKSGPLLGKYRTTDGWGVRHRMKVDVTDAGANNDTAFTVVVVCWAFSH